VGIAEVVATVWRNVVAVYGPIDEFVVMPNHLHGIIWIGKNGTPVGAQQQHRPSSGGHLFLASPDVNVVTDDIVAAPLRPTGTKQRHAFTQRPVESGSLSAIVRTFKSATAKRINRQRRTPGVPLWQRNYYEHIVRDEDDLYRIRRYIRDNPAKWNEDPLNPAVAICHFALRPPLPNSYRESARTFPTKYALARQ
jgi:REP element-mobilizing transposase RayT